MDGNWGMIWDGNASVDKLDCFVLDSVRYVKLELS